MRCLGSARVSLPEAAGHGTTVRQLASIATVSRPGNTTARPNRAVTHATWLLPAE